MKDLTDIKLANEDRRKLLDMVRRLKKKVKNQRLQLIGLNRHCLFLDQSYRRTIHESSKYQTLLNEAQEKIDQYARVAQREKATPTRGGDAGSSPAPCPDEVAYLIKEIIERENKRKESFLYKTSAWWNQ